MRGRRRGIFCRGGGGGCGRVVLEIGIGMGLVDWALLTVLLSRVAMWMVGLVGQFLRRIQRVGSVGLVWSRQSASQPTSSLCTPTYVVSLHLASPHAWREVLERTYMCLSSATTSFPVCRAKRSLCCCGGFGSVATIRAVSSFLSCGRDDAGSLLENAMPCFFGRRARDTPCFEVACSSSPGPIL